MDAANEPNFAFSIKVSKPIKRNNKNKVYKPKHTIIIGIVDNIDADNGKVFIKYNDKIYLGDDYFKAINVKTAYIKVPITTSTPTGWIIRNKQSHTFTNLNNNAFRVKPKMVVKGYIQNNIFKGIGVVKTPTSINH